MKIGLICEPRSGSQNLFKWFYQQENFTCFFKTGENRYEKPKNIDNFTNGLKELHNNCTYTTEHLAIKEDYYIGSNINPLINNSDKIIYLYRENKNEQIQSWINAKKTNNFFTSWNFRNIKDDNEHQYFLDLKKEFKSKFINNSNFTISYEELYYKNGINKITEYVGISGLSKTSWPGGEKYRNDLQIKSII